MLKQLFVAVLISTPRLHFFFFSFHPALSFPVDPK